MLFCGLLGGCASPPQRLSLLAQEFGMKAQHLAAKGYRLVAYRNGIEQPAGLLHIYLEGDGTPWLTRHRIARDPTPRNPLALRLMALDPAPSLYLGRPCYNGQHQAPGCSPWLWTQGRYSETVVATLEAAIRQQIQRENIRKIWLIGYSGGGVLAWFLAQRIPQVEVLITIAANLDVSRWTDLHGYSPLDGSLNPAVGPPLRPAVRQWHLVGQWDTNVPLELIQGLPLSRNAEILPLPSDHHCCWLQYWPRLLARLPP